MKKSELMDLVGKKVRVTFRDDDVEEGILGYVDEFSSKYNYRKPGDFYIKENPYGFKVSYTKKVEVLE